MKRRRNLKEKFNCIYCNTDMSTFCGYWKLVSIGSYSGNNKRDKTLYLQSCYAHIGCLIERHRRMIQCGVIPLATNCEIIRSPKKIVEMMRIHNVKLQKLKNTIKFLQKVESEYKSLQTKKS